jgi:hypothetical protein
MNPHNYAYLIFDKVTETIGRRKYSFFNKCCWEKCLPTCRKLKVDPCLSPYTSINTIKELNIKPKTLQLVHKRARNTLETIGIGKDFLSRTPSAQQLRERMDKWVYIKLKIFCTTKEMVSSLRTRIYRELKKLNSPNINEPIKKWTTELSRTFSNEEIQMAKNYMKKCSPSLATKETQAKTTLRFHLSPVRIANIKITTTIQQCCWIWVTRQGKSIYRRYRDR